MATRVVFYLQRGQVSSRQFYSHWQEPLEKQWQLQWLLAQSPHYTLIRDWKSRLSLPTSPKSRQGIYRLAPRRTPDSQLVALCSSLPTPSPQLPWARPEEDWGVKKGKIRSFIPNQVKRARDYFQNSKSSRTSYIAVESIHPIQVRPIPPKEGKEHFDF